MCGRDLPDMSALALGCMYQENPPAHVTYITCTSGSLFKLVIKSALIGGELIQQ